MRRWMIYAGILTAIVAQLSIVVSQTGSFRLTRAELEDILSGREWREYALTLKEQGDDAIDTVAVILEDRSVATVIRQKAALILGIIGSERAISTLLGVVVDPDIHSDIRGAAITSLGEIGSAGAASAIADVLSSDDWVIRARAANALGAIATDNAVTALITALHDPKSQVRARTLDALCTARPERAAEWYALAIGDESMDVRAIAVSGFQSMGTAGYETIARILETGNQLARFEAMTLLKEDNGVQAAPLLLECLDDSDWMIRNEAAVLLVAMENIDIVSQVVPLLGDDDINIRVTAAWLLGELDAERAVDDLTGMLDDERVAWMALQALGIIGTDVAQAAIINAYKSDSVQMRRAAIRAMSMMEDAEFNDVLTSALGDTDTEVRMLAALAIRK